MLRDSFLSMLSTGVRLLTSIVLFVVLAHVWGPATFGMFMYPYAVAAVLVKLVDYGFTLQVARDVGCAPEETGTIVGRALGAKVVLLVPAFITTAIVATRLPSGAAYLPLLILLTADAIVGSFALFLNIPLRALGRFDREASVAVGANVLFFGATVSAALAGAGPISIAVIFLAARLAFLGLAWRAYSHATGSRPTVILDRVSLKGTLTRGFPYAVHTVVGTLNLQSDTFMIQHYMGASAVGVYQAGMRLLFGALLVGDALHNVFFASLARAARDTEALNRLATRMTRQLVALGVTSFAVLLAGGHLLVGLLFAKDFAALGDLVPYFGLLVLVRYSGLAYGAVLTLAERQGVRVLAASGVLVLNLLLDVILIPRFGLRGALAASALSDLVLHLVCAVAAWSEYRKLMIDRRAVALLLAAAVALPFVLPVGMGPLVRAAAAAVFLAAAAVVGVTAEEWGSLSRSIASRISLRLASST